MVLKLWNKPLCESVWPYLDPWTALVCSQPPRIGTFQGSMDRTVSSSFSFQREEPTVLSELVEFGPCVSADTVKACALIGLRMMAEENILFLERDFSAGLGEMWRNGCPQSLEWICPGPTSEAYCGFEFYEHIVWNMAFEVIGQDRSINVVALFLKDWELGRVAFGCHMSMDLLCQEMRDACWESSESLGSPHSLCSE